MKLVPILIKEGRKEDLKKKYAKKFDNEVLDFVLGNPDLQKFNHKYTDFVLKTFEPESDIDFWVDISIGLVKDFDKYQSQLPKKDINQYETFSELENALEPILEKQKEKEEEKQVRKIYEDDKFLIVVPQTHKASCKYGSNTKWCTTSQNDDHFKRYTSGNKALYYVINKENSTNENYSKIAIHYDETGNATYWDARDNAMNVGQIEILKYAFPEIIKAIENDYTTIKKSIIEKTYTKLFNIPGIAKKEKGNLYKTNTKLEVIVDGFQTIDDMGFGHAIGTLSISLDSKLIDSYEIMLMFNPENEKRFNVDLGFSGNDPLDEENHIDFGLEGWGLKFKQNIIQSLAITIQLLRQYIANETMNHILYNPDLQKRVIGSKKVWTPSLGYGYTFGKNKGLIKKLVDWLDSGKIGTKLTFLKDIGKLDIDTSSGKPLYSHKGRNRFRPSKDFRGHFSSFFGSARLAGILDYKKVGNQFLLKKGPNFEAFKSGELKAL